MFKKLVLITRKTRLEGLIERFNTRSQAKFYIEHAGGDFVDYEREDDAYRSALDLVRRTLDFEMLVQVVDRSLVPTFQFQKEDVVVTLGQDGLTVLAYGVMNGWRSRPDSNRHLLDRQSRALAIELRLRIWDCRG